MTKKVIIFGTGEFAKLICLYLKKHADYEVVAFTANKWAIKEKKVSDLPVVPFENIETNYPPDKFSMFIAIGYSNVNKKRAKIFEEAKSKGYKFISYIHPSTIVGEGFEMGENCFIFENNVFQPYVKLGNDIIVWTGNVISHHTIVKDHCFIVSHVAIAGNVTIEPYCFFGMNSTVRNGVKIAKECVIGAGAVILEDSKEREVYKATATMKLSLTSDMLKDI